MYGFLSVDREYIREKIEWLHFTDKIVCCCKVNERKEY